MSEELRDRFAATLNYYLEQLVTAKGVSIKVDQPQKYNFDHKQLLQDIFELYCNFDSFGEVFYTAIASD